MLDTLNKKIKRSIAGGFAPTKADDSMLYDWDNDDAEVMKKAFEDYIRETEATKETLNEDIFNSGFIHGVTWGAMMGRIIKEV